MVRLLLLLCLAAAAMPAASSAGNLITNPSFEKGLNGWAAWQGTLERVELQSAPKGHAVAKVSQSGAGTAFTIDDLPDTVTATDPLVHYNARAWVKAATPQSVGKTLQLVLRERTPAGAWVRTRMAELVLDKTFRKLSVDATPTTAGNVLDVYAGVMAAAAPGDAFYIDNIQLTPSSTKPLELGVQFHCTWTSYDDGTRARVVDALADHGAQWVRIDVGWNSLEPQDPRQAGRSPWYTGLLDNCVAQAQRRQLQVLMTVHQTPPWANGGDPPAYPPLNPQDFSNVMAWLAARYPAVGAFEIWNEPDARQQFFMIHGDDPDGTRRAAAYTQLLKAGFAGVRQGNPNALVVFGAPSTNDDKFISQVYAAGARGAFDVMATHPYQGVADAPPDHPDDPPPGNVWWFSHLPAVRAVMVANGDMAKPVWLTEYGWSVGPESDSVPNWLRRVTPEQQADYLEAAVDLARKAYPYVQMMAWYKERANVLPPDTDPYGSASMYEGYALMENDLTPRPALDALKRASANSKPRP